jgi:hypothetical protein
VSTTADSFYWEEPTVEVPENYAQQTYRDGNYTLRFETSIETASLTPYTPEQGWAPEGYNWLTFEVDHTKVTGSRNTRVHLDNAATTTAVDENGERYQDVSESERRPVFQGVFDMDLWGSPPTLQVPETSTHFTVTIQPTIDWQGIIFQEQSGTAEFEPMQFEIQFSK